MAVRRLRDTGATTPEAEARWLLERASGYDGAELVLAEDEPASTLSEHHLDEMLQRRAAGEPLQYVLGSWPFRGHDLFVDPRVLVPRPETEVVAEVAIDEMVRLGARRGRSDPLAGLFTAYAVADLGTGSGALALALASELPDAEVWATDVSDDALAVARANFAGAGSVAERLRAASGSWFDALPDDLRGRLRLVVSNPPYIATDEIATLPREVVDWEPRHALVSGPTGVEALEHIVREAPKWLDQRGSVLVCELAPHQAEAVTAHATAQGFVDVAVRPDLTGRDRVLVARFLG